ncbi:hyaluronoglucosaminidase [Ancylostoma ceylanicum]|uniref:Hyaluronidase n=1 Tax=Ancylostoma ceylanicum TaxID=53326 RepID=A0A0D6LCC6_9BILA|nr:hyaluronoglucosaminidase [Ancylostoma ceylanicum]
MISNEHENLTAIYKRRAAVVVLTTHRCGLRPKSRTAANAAQHIQDLSFYGDKVVIFYEFVFGTYPYYKGYKENQPVNGGTPQNCSLEQHLEIIKKNITERIPDENFDGLAIVDLEEWRPLFDENFYGLKRVRRKRDLKKVYQP